MRPLEESGGWLKTIEKCVLEIYEGIYTTEMDSGTDPEPWFVGRGGGDSLFKSIHLSLFFN